MTGKGKDMGKREGDKIWLGVKLGCQKGEGERRGRGDQKEQVVSLGDGSDEGYERKGTQ